MSIIRAVERAYKVMRDRNWDTIYWAVDLHGVCLKSNYENGGYEFINEDALKTLRLISSLPESKIILWSSVHDFEKHAIWDFFEKNGIKINGFNCNAYEKNTKTGCFNEKFYFSVLLDDKAGFDPETDWWEIYKFIYSIHYE